MAEQEDAYNNQVLLNCADSNCVNANYAALIGGIVDLYNSGLNNEIPANLNPEIATSVTIGANDAAVAESNLVGGCQANLLTCYYNSGGIQAVIKNNGTIQFYSEPYIQMAINNDAILPVATTGQVVGGALLVTGVGGVIEGGGIALAPVLTGAVAGGTANAAVQLSLTGTVDPGSVLIALSTVALTGGGSGTNIVAVNAGSYLLTNPTNPAGVGITVAAALLGVGTGSAVQDSLDAEMNPVVLQGFLGVTDNTPSLLPLIGGDFAGGVASEVCAQGICQPAAITIGQIGFKSPNQ